MPERRASRPQLRGLATVWTWPADHGWGMKIKTALVGSVLACLAGAQTAGANELGFYIGGSVAQVSKEVPRREYELLNADLQTFFFFTPTQDSQSFDERDTGFSLFAGYYFTPHIAIEGGYSRLGQVTFKSRATGNFPQQPGTLNQTIESETSGFTAAVIGALPLTRDWEVFARVGALIAINKLSISIRATGDQFIPPSGNRASDSFSKGSTDVFAAVGVSRRVFEIYDLRLEYQRILEAGFEITGGQADLDAVQLGLAVTF
jgi:OmpA-OmpF porin, OOP family